MDLYSTHRLNRIVTDLRTMPKFFLQFFPEVVEQNTEEVLIDYVEGKPRITPFVHPMREGRVVEDKGFSTRSVRPAYLKDKRVHNPLKAIKRRAGEAIGGSLTPEQRLRMTLVSDLQDQLDMLDNRLEVMAAEAVIYGRATIKGDGFDSVVDFGRKAENTIALAGTDKWTDAGSDKGRQLEDWDEQLRDVSGGNTDMVVMDKKAWQLLRADEKLFKLLDVRRGFEGVNLNLAPMKDVEGLSFKGYYGDFPIYVYQSSYTDPLTGQTVQVMPDNTVLMISRRIEGVRHYGAIMDVDVLRPQAYHVKSWLQEDPSVRYLLMQSAPLLVPYRMNAVLRIQVA